MFQKHNQGQMEEEWRDIEGYEGLYQVSNLGRVKRLPKIMKTTTDAQGYKVISLKDESGKAKVVKVHRLVAQAFLPNPENKPVVDHINTDRGNNFVDNLRWCTQKENCNNPITLSNRKCLPDSVGY